MIFANLNEEKRLWEKGHKYVVGVDEAGRGSLAGPVVAAAVIINPKFQTLNPKQIRNSKFQCSKHVLKFGNLDFDIISNLGFRILDLKLRDSKKLSPKKRKEFYRILTTHSGIEWGIGKVSAKIIDKINILEATKLAMERAIEKLKFVETSSHLSPSSPLARSAIKNEKLKTDYLIIDGNFKLDLPISQKSIIKADEKVFSCAAASIIAKVTRDRMMQKYHKKYPQYGFDKHKGYPVRRHVKILKKYGPCKIHRKTFSPTQTLDFKKQSG